MKGDTKKLTDPFATGMTVPGGGAPPRKLPETTLTFWLAKMISATSGQAVADYLNIHCQCGLTGTLLLSGLLLIVALFYQMNAMQYQAVTYWTTLALISMFSTLTTDSLTDIWQLPPFISAAGFAMLLLVIFAAWYLREKSLTFELTGHPFRETCYWLAMSGSCSLGTLTGDGLAERLALSYGSTALLFGVWVVIVTVACFTFNANRVLCFWCACILTLPFGEACSDLLLQPQAQGGLGSGESLISLVLLAALLIMAGERLVCRWRYRRVRLKCSRSADGG